jgi:hypothetical protein
MPEYNLYQFDSVLKKIYDRLDKVECCCASTNGANIGLGEGVFYKKNKYNIFQFKSLIAGDNITLVPTNNSITINSTGGGGSFNCSQLSTCSTTNLPEGTNLYYTDARVLSYMTGKNISIFNNDSGYIKLTDLSSGTGISYNNLTGVITNTLPDQTVALSSGTGISITGTYPNFTITNTSPSSGGTVTSVGATSPITSSGGTTPTISTSMATNRLIGRTTSGTGVMEEITVGTGLSLSGGTLSATASSSVGFEMNFLLMGA